jgi:dTDP-4-amino-4,6-dideoxy-D-galactose acyltransferase
MQKNKVENLEWDSRFFGYPVARITLDKEGSDKLDHLFLNLETGKFRVTYFFVPPEEKELIYRITKKGGILVDQKMGFSKITERHNQYSNDIVEFQGIDINEKLIELVLQAGKYSRFCLDKNFTNKEYQRLYIEWLSKSILKEIAFKVLVAKNGSDLIGITTLSEKEQLADIGLVAVDENFQGQGIGYDLIRSADTVAFEKGIKEIKVVTQFENKRACRLYEKCHFQIEKITNIYHYWQ